MANSGILALAARKKISGYYGVTKKPQWKRLRQKDLIVDLQNL
jgi:hypothetical protein